MCFGNGVKIPSKAYFLLIRSSFISEFFVLIYAFFQFLQEAGVLPQRFSDFRGIQDRGDAWSIAGTDELKLFAVRF